MKRLRELRKQRGMTIKELAEALGVSEAAVSLYESGRRRPGHEQLCRIADLFAVSVDYLLERELLPVPQGRIPIYGAIRACGPGLAFEEPQGYHLADVPPGEEYFCLKVKGDSMEGAGIRDGYVVLLRRQDFARDGQIVACMVDGENATLKRFQRVGRKVTLWPENSRYSPILLDLEDFDNGTARILGVVVEVSFRVE